MVGHLSPEWIAALDDAARHDGRLAAAAREAAAAGTAVTIEHVVTATGGGEAVVWHVCADDGAVRVRPGPAPSADVRFTTDRRTAEAIARGEESAQAAFARGALRIGGDPQKLLAARSLVAAAGDVFASVRARTGN